jgi:class 3 adenylate cyclase
LEYQARIDRLVAAMFPPGVVDEWKEHEAIRPRRYEKIGVLFLDVVGFTAWCEARRDDPEAVVRTLQELVATFEATAARHGVQKIKTIGDAFMAASGLTDPDPNPALTLLKCGLDLIADVRAHKAGWQVRIGIHVGPVVTGVLGQTQFSFDVWGHTVNAAARMESNGRAGMVTLSEDAWNDVATAATGTPREAAVKGLGAVTVWDVSAG